MADSLDLNRIAAIAEDAKFAKANIEGRRATAESWASVDAYERRVTPSTVLALVAEIRALQAAPLEVAVPTDPIELATKLIKAGWMPPHGTNSVTEAAGKLSTLLGLVRVTGVPCP